MDLGLYIVACLFCFFIGIALSSWATKKVIKREFKLNGDYEGIDDLINAIKNAKRDCINCVHLKHDVNK